MSFPDKMHNNEFDDQLLECSVLVVSLLINQYKAKAIDKTDFKIHTKNKINYIINNLGIIKDTVKKSSIESLINECNEINNTL
ncbi:MAG TPA: hypothetical protein VIK78_04630 [Ruminiclostridium sp.]